MKIGQKMAKSSVNEINSQVLDNLSSEQWYTSLLGKTRPYEVAKRINSQRINHWSQPIIDNTSPRQSILELGSGTGELSGILANNNRIVTLLDWGPATLKFSKNVFKLAGMDGHFVQADVTKQFPFSNNCFDCVWSSGLLEHFSQEQIDFIIMESSRVSKNLVISLVPNAFSLLYRWGKWYQERNGIWKWGKEEPKHSLRKAFEKAGLVNIVEYSIDVMTPINSAMTSIRNKKIRAVVYKCFRMIPQTILKKLNQGYLLVTIGEKLAVK